MGFNTVFFVLNDHMSSLVRAPKTVAWAMAHPPMSEDERDQKLWRDSVCKMAEYYMEPAPHFQALRALGSFHADSYQFLYAGGNSAGYLDVIKYGKTKDGKLTVTLELPDNFPAHPETMKKGR